MSTHTTQVVSPRGERSALAKLQRGARPTPPRTMLLILIGLAVEIAIMYGRSINNGFVGDDWTLLDAGSHGVAFAVHWFGVYHYNPIPQLVTTQAKAG